MQESLNQEKPFSLGYVRQLDGLRGIAILYVVLFHSYEAVFMGGFVGVDIFFVLSGFLITSLLLEERRNTGRINLRMFYLRRILRLFPALLLLLFVYVIVCALVMQQDAFYKNVVDAGIALFYVTNWARAFDIHPPNYLGHTWSLSIEEQFYILWPLTLIGMFWIFKSYRTVLAGIVCLSIISWLLRIYHDLSGSLIERSYNGLDTRADCLLVGCALAVFLHSSLYRGYAGELLKRFSKVLAVVAIAFLVWALFALHWRSRHYYYWGTVAVELATVSIIFHLITSPAGVIGRLLSVPGLIWLGGISYGLYLWHMPVYGFLSLLELPRLTFVALGLSITVVVSMLSYYLIEKPILRYKRRFRVGIASVCSTGADSVSGSCATPINDARS